jgi:hypothetical protein
MKKRSKKILIPKEDQDKLLKIKKSLIEMKKMLNEAKKEAERIDKEKKEEKNIVIFQKDE